MQMQMTVVTGNPQESLNHETYDTANSINDANPMAQNKELVVDRTIDNEKELNQRKALVRKQF